MYAYVPLAEPDYDEILDVTPHNTITESGEKSQEIHTGDDGSEERISLSNQTIFYLKLQWSKPTSAEVDVILAFYHDPAKANGRARSFKYAHIDGHVYVVRFDSKADKEIQSSGRYAVPGVTLRVLGKI